MKDDLNGQLLSRALRKRNVPIRVHAVVPCEAPTVPKNQKDALPVETCYKVKSQSPVDPHLAPSAHALPSEDSIRPILAADMPLLQNEPSQQEVGPAFEVYSAGFEHRMRKKKSVRGFVKKLFCLGHRMG